MRQCPKIDTPTLRPGLTIDTPHAAACGIPVRAQRPGELPRRVRGARLSAAGGALCGPARFRRARAPPRRLRRRPRLARALRQRGAGHAHGEHAGGTLRRGRRARGANRAHHAQSGYAAGTGARGAGRRHRAQARRSASSRDLRRRLGRCARARPPGRGPRLHHCGRGFRGLRRRDGCGLARGRQDGHERGAPPRFPRAPESLRPDRFGACSAGADRASRAGNRRAGSRRAPPGRSPGRGRL